MPKSSKSWLKTRQCDPYIKQAQQHRYRARSVYKLAQIDRRYRLFKCGQQIVDLGAAPGSWSQYAIQRVGAEGSVIAVDRLPMQAIRGVRCLQGDFTHTPVCELCLAQLQGRKADLVISDMAPNLSGIRHTDQARSIHLAELALDFARQVLTPGGGLLLKLFQGSGADLCRDEIMRTFQKVSVCKPEASRNSSREFYVLAQLYEV